MGLPFFPFCVVRPAKILIINYSHVLFYKMGIRRESVPTFWLTWPATLSAPLSMLLLFYMDVFIGCLYWRFLSMVLSWYHVGKVVLICWNSPKKIKALWELAVVSVSRHLFLLPTAALCQVILRQLLRNVFRLRRWSRGGLWHRAVRSHGRESFRSGENSHLVSLICMQRFWRRDARVSFLQWMNFEGYK